MFRLFECCALSFFERFVLSFSLKIERFVSDSAEIWICGLYIYNFVMMVDMEMMLSQPETYVRLIPNFFFRQSNFFRHFMLAVQFTCTEGVVYPNIVLLYKG